MNFYFIGIGGIGMASAAGCLSAIGHSVEGSDAQVEPPTRDILRRNRIPFRVGYSRTRLASIRTDFYVVGSIVSRAPNEELEYAYATGLPILNFPQVVSQFIAQDKFQIVVAGTHGKTTTSALIAQSLNSCGRSASFLIGGELISYRSSFFYTAESPIIVIEGDEYISGPNDYNPKFFYYSPKILVLNNIELDHIDVYPDLESIKAKFRTLVSRLPADSVVVANADDPHVCDVCSAFNKVIYYTLGTPLTKSAQYRIENWIPAQHGRGTRFKLCCSSAHGGGYRKEFETPLIGEFNLRNVVASIAVLEVLECASGALKEAVANFGCVRRRLERISDRDGIVVYDDFAHHPTAVHVTLSALRQVIGQESRLIAVFEPASSSSRRRAFMDAYAQSFSAADFVVIGEIGEDARIAVDAVLDPRELAQKIGENACHYKTADEILETLERRVRSNDHIVFMSSGSSSHLADKFVCRHYGLSLESWRD